MKSDVRAGAAARSRVGAKVGVVVAGLGTLALLIPQAMSLPALTAAGRPIAARSSGSSAPSPTATSSGTTTSSSTTTTEAEGPGVGLGSGQDAGEAATGTDAGSGSGTQTSGAAATGAGTNLLTGAQASFSGTTGGWVGINATLAWVHSPSTVSTGSLALTVTQTSWPEAWSWYPPDGSPTAASAGGKFSGEATVDVTGSPGPTSVALAFFNSSGALVGTAIGQAVTPSASTWTTLPEVAGVAPAASASVAVGVIEFTGTDGQTIYVNSPVLSALGAGSPSVDGPLRTSGNKIIQADGQPVVLQGVVLDGLEYSGTLSDSGVTYDAVLEAKAWGANFVRVPLGEQFWLSSNCDYVSSYESSVDQVVKWITSLGMVALLDLHTNTVGGCETGTEHNMADEAQSPTFWSEVAGRYGNPASPEYSPLVAFDLYNEPHDISNGVWLDGGQTTDYYSPNQTYQAAGMQQLYDSVRSAGSQNLVFISGNNWANDPPAQLVSGTNIVYAVHYYTCPSVAPPSCTTADPYDPDPGLEPWVSFSASEPMVVTEFGWPSDASGTYLANVIAFAQTYGWGWSAYSWAQNSGAGGWNLATFLADGTAEPNPSGVPVLLALSGSG